MIRFVLFLFVAVAPLFFASAAQADDPIPLAVRYDNRKMSREDCARKAVEAMGVKEKFPFAEVTKDGNAQGWNDEVAVQVLSYAMPDPDRVFIIVIVAGTDGPETNRVMQSVQAHLTNDRVDPATPAKITPAAGKIPPRPVTLIHKFEDQGANPILRHFGPAATIVLEKKGYQTTVSDGLVLGFLPDRSTLAFLAPTNRVTSARLNVVYATPGEESGEAAARDLLAQIVNVLYD